MLRAAALLFLPALMFGQGTIQVDVRDPSGAALEASGKLSGSSIIRFQTDSKGAYTATSLAFRKYHLEIFKAGFATQSVDIDVRSEVPVTRIITLTLQSTAYRVDVIAATPLPGSELELNQVPSPVQVATHAEMEQSAALNLADFMNRRLNGVQINEMQSNPFQPDVNYRGYTASPLLGTPQGISVYMDGVRQNQPFGDVVSWDLIPKNAIETVELMPGSNPLFGLNTLGGALSVQTRDGLTSPGLAARIVYGSSGRKGLEAEYGGGKPNGFHYFLATNILHESGWRTDSPSDVKQAFIKLGHRGAMTNFAFTTTYAYNTLTGNGLQDSRLLARNYSSVYTIPDTTGNRSPSFDLIAHHAFNSTLSLSGNAWFRNIRTENINGNANIDALTGAPLNSPFPTCDAQSICDAITIFSKEVQNDFGASGQITKRNTRNQFIAGAVFDRGSVGFTQNTQYGYLNPDRTITGVAQWQDDSRVDLHGTTPNWSLFATDTLSLGKWNLTLSGRFNRSSIDNADRINPIAGPGSLDGRYVFQRFNPSAGVTYNPWHLLTVFANYSQSSRAPTSIELGCADPSNPCSLPNALASDPPLKQVVASTWEVGLRGKFERNIHWTLDGFRATNRDDILFIAAPQLGTGYFQNFGKTERQGVQASADARINRFTLGADYTFLNATYQVSTTLADGTNIHPGNRIPLVPKQSGKIYLDVQATKKLALNLGGIANSSAYARGNESNSIPDGVSPGYVVVNIQAHYDFNKRWQLAVQTDNLFGRHYDTAAQLASSVFSAHGTVLASPVAATFFSPGAPRRAWVELRFKW